MKLILHNNYILFVTSLNIVLVLPAEVFGAGCSEIISRRFIVEWVGGGRGMMPCACTCYNQPFCVVYYRLIKA